MRLSATQIRIWHEQCKMLWYLSYVLKKRPPQSVQQNIGEKIHKVLEEYIKDGVYPDLTSPYGKMASHALHLIPMERALQSEIRFSELPVQLKCEFEFAGVIDLLSLDGDVPLVYDFKTTKDKRWIKPVYSLSSDIQLMMYAKAVLECRPDADKIQIGLIYIGKNEAKPFAQEVSKIVSRDEVELFWQAVIMQSAKEIQFAGLSQPNEIERNYDFCPAFGGCKIQGVCETVGSSI